MSFTIQLNGQAHEIPEPMKIEDLIQRVCPEQKRVIVEFNGRIIRRPEWTQTLVQEGDTIELVHLVGGG